jgi:hypothetical protein
VGNLFRITSLFMAAALCLAASCAKKDNKAASQKESTAPPVISETSQGKAKPDTGGDIFDEFYQNDKGTAKAATAATAAGKAAGTKTSAKKAAALESAPQFSGKGNYVVQISCVGSKRLAQKVVQELEGQGYQAYSTEVSNPVSSLNGTYYRIRIGPFETIAEARSFAESNLTPKGYQYWVDRKSRDSKGSEAYPAGSAGAGEYAPQSSAPASETPFQSSTPAVSEPAPAPAVEQPAAPPPAAEPAPAPATPPPAAEPAPAAAPPPPAAAPSEPAGTATGSKAASDSVW